MKLAEKLTVVAIVGILAAISLPTYLDLVNRFKLNAAINQIVESMKQTRYAALDEEPKTVCIRTTVDRIEIAGIHGTDCENGVGWNQAPSGIKIDEPNSTLRRVASVAGNHGKIYRASWATTAAGYGGSWGQLGRITLTIGTHRKCVFLKNVQGDIEVKRNRSCLR